MNLPGIPSIYLNQLGNSVSNAPAAGKVSLQQGQIVQATVLKLLPGQLATVLLGGLVLTALLETPLKVGQKAWLQVESDGDTPKLKILEQPTSSMNLQTSTLPDSSLEGLLEALHIDIPKEQKEIVQTLQDQNTPLTKDFLQSLPKLMGELGASRETLEAMSLVNQKGLPLTKETVQSVKTFMQNQSVDKQIDNILNKLDSEATLNPEASDTDTNTTPDISSSLRMQLQQLKWQLGSMKQMITSFQQYILGSNDNLSEPLQNAFENGSPISQTSVPHKQNDSALQSNALSNISNGTESLDKNSPKTIGQLVDVVKGWLSPDADVGTAPFALDELELLQNSNQTSDSTNMIPSSPDLEQTQTADPSSQLQNPAESHVGQAQAILEQEPKDLIAHFLQGLGLDYEGTLAQATDPTSMQHELENAQSLKAAILQILQHPDAAQLSSAIKQDLQQMIHHITGQQLLMSNETNPVFSQFSLQIPIPGSQTDQNAMIHVEARKKPNGRIDTDNCRLFFYLTMQHIGETMLDVTIVNKILSVSLYNNQPRIVQMVKETQNKLKATLSEQGYYLSQITIMPVPSKPDQFIKAPPKSLTEYKGVDFKI